jgi:pseudoazurin
MQFRLPVLFATASIILVQPAAAADHQVQMLNKGELGAMVFEPSLVEIAPGDTVTFVPTDKGHNAESIPGYLPEGAETFKGKINQEITVQFDMQGAYGVKCQPHFGLGMVALVVVGENLSNLEAGKSVKVPKKAQERFELIYQQLGQ